MAAVDYYPFGETVRNYYNGGDNTRYMITEKERDWESEYDNFGGRYYNSEIGRWLSADPLAILNPGQSPYAYCRNNPLAYIDPSGLEDQGIDRGLWQYGEIVVTASRVYLQPFSDPYGTRSGGGGRSIGNGSGHVKGSRAGSNGEVQSNAGLIPLIFTGLKILGWAIAIAEPTPIGEIVMTFVEAASDAVLVVKALETVSIAAETFDNYSEAKSAEEKFNADPNAPKIGQEYRDKQGNSYKFEPPKNWNFKKDRKGNYPDNKGRAWTPLTDHKGYEANKMHHDIQLRNGNHIRVWPVRR